MTRSRQWMTIAAVTALAVGSWQTIASIPGMAQSTDLGCRQTNGSTGVYEQPNLDSTSRGVLNRSQTVRLQAAGDGWARIVEPVIGWVEVRYLTPSIPCPTAAAPSPSPSPFPTPSPSPAAPATPDRPPRPEAAAESISVVCDVLPAEGLAVRSEPNSADDTYLTTIAQGEHTFRFTRNTQLIETADGVRQWIFITAPQEGWISPGLLNGASNLGGDECG